MSKTSAFWTLWPLWSAAGLAIGVSSGCTALRPPQTPLVETTKACADWRWIGISRPGTLCPDIPGWTVRPLFPQLSPARQSSEDYCAREVPKRGDYCAEKESEPVPGPEVIRELSRFCVYEVVHKGLVAKRPPAGGAALVRLDQDCAGLATPLPKYSGEGSASHEFLAEAGVPAAKLLTIANPNGVRLSFLDTQPTSRDLPQQQGNSPHGFALAYIGRSLVCQGELQGELCAAWITTRLALPIIEFNPKSLKLTKRDTVNGGYLGMQSDLAEAIRSEVDAWQLARWENRGSSEQRHLVLNLSLAWDGELFGGLGEEQVTEMRAGTQAVYRALQYAAGFDALVLAAAGNQKREPCSNFGPLLPAAWEAGGGLEESCRKPQKPLIYAVGGLGAGGFALENARPGGMPRRAAYAENAVVPCPAAPHYSVSLTGSSVATAVVSSIAAVVWASFPELRASEVMDILDESGDPLPMAADFWFGASGSSASARPRVHRLALCPALKQACDRPGSGPCPVELPCVALPSFSSASLRPVARRARESCKPWLFPQPEDIPCPNCLPPPPPPP